MPDKPTDPLILQCLGLFETVRRMGADPDHVFFVSNEEVGTGMLVGTKLLQLSEPASPPDPARHDALMLAWNAGAVWWNTNPQSGEQHAVFLAFLDHARETNILFFHEAQQAVASCPRGDA